MLDYLIHSLHYYDHTHTHTQAHAHTSMTDIMIFTSSLNLC